MQIEAGKTYKIQYGNGNQLFHVVRIAKSGKPFGYRYNRKWITSSMKPADCRFKSFWFSSRNLRGDCHLDAIPTRPAELVDLAPLTESKELTAAATAAHYENLPSHPVAPYGPADLEAYSVANREHRIAGAPIRDASRDAREALFGPSRQYARRSRRRPRRVDHGELNRARKRPGFPGRFFGLFLTPCVASLRSSCRPP